uniref:BTB domain-containing protein n=1 Tax=Panagrolaimus sp. ES5 TaxID=591445 RepID=A0AC34FRK4_9BILA
MEENHKVQLKCPIAIKWPISEERLKELKEKPGECLKSDTFTASNIPGVGYHLSIYPNDDLKDYKRKTCIYLHLSFIDKIEIGANWNITIESTNYSFNRTHVFKKSIGKLAVICTTDELFDPENEYFVNGKLVVEINGILIIEKEMPKKIGTFGDHRDALCLGLWNQDENKDFAIAHKLILAARSPVFARMFQSGLKEAQENKVEIKDFSFDIVEAAIKLCYHQSLITDITLEDKEKLLQFFDKYDIVPLKNDLENNLISEIDVSTVCQLTNFSLLSNASNLNQKCAEFLQTCLDKKTPVSDFSLLDKDFALKLFQKAFYPVSK